MTQDALDRLFEQSPPTLNPSEVAERLRVTPKSVYAWLRQGLIPGYKVGTTWFVIRDELKDTLRAGANPHRHTGPVVVIEPGEHEGN